MDNSSFNNPSKIIGIQFSIFSPEEIEKYSVVEVTNKETYVGIKPKIGGLFDPRMGVSEPGMICPTDGMNYINSPGYFGHVKLCKPIFYIQYLNMVIDILKCVCNKCGKLLISKKTYQSLTKYPAAKRWQKVLELCKNPQLKRCGDETDNGCGCMRATKIKQEGFATIVAEWINQTESYTLKITPEMAINILKKISDEDVNFMGFSNIWSRPEWMICKTFAVPPPAVRPSVKHDAQQRSEDDLTHIIINIIKINNKIKQLTESGEQDNQKNVDDWIQVLQYYIATMVDNNISGASPVTQRSGRALKSISERHKGKQGRVRGNLMGKRVDFSARSVITPDPELSISELGVPMKIAKNITKPVKVQNFNYKYLSYLVKNGPHKYPGAKLIEKPNGITISLGYIDRDNVKIEIGDIVHRHMLDGDVVLFNRQPTLHRMSMMAHIVKVMPVGDTFRMNVADTKPYNADFDGDEMNMHMPQNDEAECELRYLANVPNHIISPGNNKPIVGIFQDSMVGSFLYTRENISFTKKQAMNLLVKTNCFNACNLFDDEKDKYSSFEVLSEIIPKISLKYKTDLFTDNESVETSNRVLEINDGKIVRGQHDKGVFGSSSKGIIHRIRKDFGSEACKDYIDNLQAIITEYMKTTGFSVGISDLIADEETKQKINSIIQEKKTEVSNLIDQVHIGLFENKTGKSNLEEFETQVNNILNKASNDAGKAGIRSLDKENRFVSIVTSGSKGNELNISQMISCLGQQNVDGKRIPYGYTNRTLPHFKQFDDTPKARGFVESSFISGLSPDELFFHAMGGRVGLIDTAVKTSTTGYIQRRLIKGMEDIQVMYDNTIRNNKNKVIQFSYGGTNWDTTMIESMQFQLVDNKTIDIYKNYSYEFMNEFQDTKIKQSRKNTHLKLIYDSKALSKFKEQKEKLKEKCLADIKYLLGKRDEMVINVYNNEDENKIYLPVHFTNMIERVKNHFQITTHSLSNITPLEAYKIIERKYDVLKQTFKPCEKFKIAYTYYMNPYNLIHNHKYHKDAIVFLCESIINIYKQSLVNPGEMVGMVGAQSIGEPTTQMSLHADEKIRIIKCLRGTEEYETMTVKIGEFCDSIIQDNPHQTFNTGYQDSVETILEGDDYFVVGVDGKEKTAWNRISHVSKHPVNGELMKVITRSGRTVRTTTSHSHLVRRNQTVEPITGSDMKVGMRIPVCKHVRTSSSFKTEKIKIGDIEYQLDATIGWFIGAYLAEGSINYHTIGISNISEHYKSKTSNIASIFGKISKYTEKEGEYGISGTTSFTHKELAKIIRETCGVGSYKKCIPSFAFTAPKEFKSALIQGYFDGDGNIHSDKKHHQIRASSRSEQLIKDVIQLLSEFGIFATIHSDRRNMFNLNVSAKYARTYKEHIDTVIHTDKLHNLIGYEERNSEHARPDAVEKINGLGNVIAECGKTLNLPGQSRNYGRWAKKDSIGVRTLRKYIAEFQKHPSANCISKQLAILRQAADADVVWDEVVSIEIYTPDQNEYVYDFTVPKTQTFMVDNGIIVHNTLNTFHFAGISSKSNVTRGVPRIEELLTLTKKPKNPSLTIYLDQETSMDANASYNIASKIEHTRLINIVNKAEIYYEPQEFESLIDEDDKLMKEYVEFSDIIRKCYDEEEDGEDGDEELDETNNWIIRLELNGTQMFDMNITNEDVHYILKTECPSLQGTSNNIKCFYTDYNDSDKIVFRIRVNIDSKRGSKNKDVFTEEDYIHYVKTYMDKILNELVIRGTKNIEKVNLRKINNYKIMNHETGDFDKKEMYVLDTIGTNLSDILKLDYIDKNKTFSNDIIEMKNILGIEAARRCLFNEILEVMEFDSTYINHHHIHLLCDRMTCNHKMVSIFRHGINKDDIGPIAKASFEETTEMFLQAARHGELDNMRGVSANVMCGQEGYYGTSSFQIHIDNDLLKKNNEELGLLIEDVDNNELYADELMEPEEVMNLEEEKNIKNNDKCSLENLKTASTLSSTSKNKIIDNGYNLDI